MNKGTKKFVAGVIMGVGVMCLSLLPGCFSDTDGERIDNDPGVILLSGCNTNADCGDTHNCVKGMCAGTTE